MSKHKFTTGLRRVLSGLITDIKTVIVIKLKEANDSTIEGYKYKDVDGVLVVIEKPVQDPKVLKPLTVVDSPKVTVAYVISPPSDNYGFGLKRTKMVKNILKSIKGNGLVEIN